MRWAGGGESGLSFGCGVPGLILGLQVVVVTTNVYICLLCFCMFEGACGIYFPAMGTLKAEYLPSALHDNILLPD